MSHHRFHVCSLPHTQTTLTHNACAYTTKVYRFCKMMMEAGHEVYHYGCEGSNPPCTEHISVISLEDQKLLCGDNNWKRQMYDIVWDERMPYWQLTNSKSVAEIKKRHKDNDFLCVIGGSCQKPIHDGLKGLAIRTVEFGIGYKGVFAPHKIFESYAHQARVYGMLGDDPDGNFYDAVIPNYYDISEFPFVEKKLDYYLYIGRFISRKGIQIAVETCNSIGAKLLMVGQGVQEYAVAANGKPARLKCGEASYEGNFEYLGFADIPTRAKLMGNAKAVFVPTIYLGPFEGVNVESQLCGTPVISTDWGVFPETVEHGKTGYRCRTHEQFCWAAKNVHNLDPKYIRERAVANWSLSKVSKMYCEYFDQLSNLSKKGYYEENPNRTELDWLIKK